MKQISSKRAKLERNRDSIVTDKLDTCYICGQPKNDLHELLGGANRTNSMKYGLVIPLCRGCHFMAHNNPTFEKELKKLGQRAFESYYDEDFVSIFKRNYL